jgi:hypothetical protein
MEWTPLRVLLAGAFGIMASVAFVGCTLLTWKEVSEWIDSKKDLGDIAVLIKELYEKKEFKFVKTGIFDKSGGLIAAQQWRASSIDNELLGRFGEKDCIAISLTTSDSVPVPVDARSVLERDESPVQLCDHSAFGKLQQEMMRKLDEKARQRAIYKRGLPTASASLSVPYSHTIPLRPDFRCSVCGKDPGTCVVNGIRYCNECLPRGPQPDDFILGEE